MSKQEKLGTAVVEATGDDTVIDVAEFQPKGTAAAVGAGAAAGSIVGGGVSGSGWGRGFGAAGGAVAGKMILGVGKDLPPRVAVAVSPDDVYLLGMKAYGYHVDPLARIDRDQLGVEVHQRLSVRTVVLEDLERGHRFALEVSRLNFYHAKAMVQLLMMTNRQTWKPRKPERTSLLRRHI